MSDIKIGDKVVGIKGATRVAGIVMNIKEGHVHIKSPVSGVYAPVLSIVPMHKVTKLGEGAMKRKSEEEDHSGMDDYLAQKAEEEKKKKKEVKEDAAKAVTNKNQEHAVHVAGQPVTAYPNATQAQRVGIKLKDMLGNKTVSVHHMGEEVEQIDEGPQKKRTRMLNKIRDARIGAEFKKSGGPMPDAGPEHKTARAFNTAVGRALRKMSEESSHSVVNNLKADGKHEEAGAKAFEHGLGRKYGQHFGLRSTKDKDEASFHRGYDAAEMKGKKKVDEEVEQIDEKRMYQNKPVKMTAHTEKDGKVYKGTHTVIVKKVPTLDTPTIQAQTRKRAEKSLKAHLKSRGHKVTDIEHLEEAPNYRTHGSYDRDSNDIFDRSRRGFKSREHEFEAGVEAQHHAAQVQHDSEPHHIYINGRVWKKDGHPVTFNNKKHANAVGLSILKKNPKKVVQLLHHSFHAKHGDTMPTSNS